MLADLTFLAECEIIPLDEQRGAPLQSYMTIDELTAEANAQGKPVSRRYIARLCQDKQLRCEKVGTGRRGVWLIPCPEARRWLQEWASK